jgi:hypothetical protein
LFSFVTSGLSVEEAHYDALGHSRFQHPFGNLFVLPANIAAEKAKASSDGEDVITPLVEQEATAIMTEVSKKK